jgi:hypothetical protein
MQTISSSKSLIFWSQNINGSNITSVKNNLFLKDYYLNVFNELKTRTSIDGVKIKFLNMWHCIINDECKKLNDTLLGIGANKNNIQLVINKFRGNLGEILAEKLFLYFGMNFGVIPSSYIPVDPTNEEFIDAQGRYPGDNLPIGIQIKNYASDNTKTNCVTREPFIKSMAMSTHWIQNKKIIDSEKLIQFYSMPRQIIFSFTDVADTRILTDYAESIRFIGPKEIKKLDLENKNNSYIFDEIFTEIR